VDASRQAASPTPRSTRGRACVQGTLTLLLAASLGACGGGSGDGSGPDDWPYPLTVDTDVAVVDLDGDGRQDVLTLEQLATSETDRKGRLLYYRQTDTGAFAAPVVTVVGSYPWHFAIADLDGDGAPDIVIIDAGTDSAWLLWQDAVQRGRFEPPLQLATDIHGYDPVIADLNGDGAADIALPGRGSPPALATVRILYQDPLHAGDFLPAVDLSMPGNTAHVAAGDLNQDGRSDLAASVLTSGGGTTPPTILLGYRPQLADGSLGPFTSPASHTGLNVARLSVADYDGDGAQDLFAYLTPYSVQYTATLTVVLQDAAPGAFLGASNTRLEDVRGIDDAAFADLDRDGRPDAAVAGFFPTGSPSRVESRANLFTQSGGGLFAPTTVHEMPVAVARIAAGDLNGDGATDLVGFAGADGCVVMLQSATTPGAFSPPHALR
jgi:hypothetical protein